MSEVKYTEDKYMYYLKRIVVPVLQVLAFLILARGIKGLVLYDTGLALMGVFLIGYLETKIVTVSVKEDGTYNKYAIYIGMYHLLSRFFNGIIREVERAYNG